MTSDAFQGQLREAVLKEVTEEISNEHARVTYMIRTLDFGS